MRMIDDDDDEDDDEDMVGLCRIDPCEHTIDTQKPSPPKQKEWFFHSLIPTPPQIVPESILVGISPPNIAKAEEPLAGTTQFSWKGCCKMDRRWPLVLGMKHAWIRDDEWWNMEHGTWMLRKECHTIKKNMRDGTWTMDDW